MFIYKKPAPNCLMGGTLKKESNSKDVNFHSVILYNLSIEHIPIVVEGKEGDEIK